MAQLDLTTTGKYVISTALAVYLFLLLNKAQPSAYMDEIFHIPQTIQYCYGNFKTWDSKITTPPGLYALGYLYWQVVAFVQSVVEYQPLNSLDPIVFRSLNLLGVFVFLPLVMWRLYHIDFTSLIAFPLLAFYANLYYTDVWSSLFVLLALGLAERGTSLSKITAAVFSLLSLFFRQTNVIWAAFVGIYILDSGTISKTICAASKRNFYTVTVPFGLVGLLFLVFVNFNGGIPLGDKNNHTIAANVPQLFYFSLFFLLFSWPLFFSPVVVRAYWRSNFKTPLRFLTYVASIAVICLIIDQLTIVHPFILADNSHYTFYIWRKLINPSWSPWAKFALAPVYHIGLWIYTWAAYNGAKSWITATALLIAVSATLVPSPLLEPRYYILPYLVWRILCVQPLSSRRTFEWLWYEIINTATVLVFIYRPYVHNYNREIRRFMW